MLVHAEDFGAYPDNGDVTPMLRQALLANGGNDLTLVLKAGRYELRRTPGGYSSLEVLGVRGRNVTIQGEGHQTVLALVGDLLAGAQYVVAVHQGARDVTIRDLTIDTMGAFNTEEQDHCIAVGTGAGTGPIEGVTIERVRFRHGRPPGATARKGDGVRVLGYSKAWPTNRVLVRDCVAESCQRSFVGFQRNVHDATVERCTTYDIGDTVVDCEITGATDESSSGLRVLNNVFWDTGAAQGEWAVTMGGHAPADRVQVSGNTMRRGVNVYKGTDVLIHGNTITHLALLPRGTLSCSNAVRGLVVTGNTVRRSGVAGPCFRANAQAGQVPTGLLLQGNLFEGGGVFVEDGRDLTVVACQITSLGQFPLDVRGVTQAPWATVVSGCTLRGLQHSLQQDGVLYQVRAAAQDPRNALKVTGTTFYPT